jgi:hypothetical protein
MPEEPNKETEPEAQREEEKADVEEGKEPPMRDEGLDRSASGAHRVLGDTA